MNKEISEHGKKCFIITPIGDANSETFRKAKGVIESVIKPVLQNYGFNDIKPAYEMNISGMITTQIINRIISDDLVVVNITGNNPNVMYELCLRHVVQKPVIHICEMGTILPFDIKDNRTIFYKDDMLGAAELKENLKVFIKEIDYKKAYVDNPIYNAQKIGMLLQRIPEDEGKSVEIGLLQKIYELLDNKVGGKQRYILFPKEIKTNHISDDKDYDYILDINTEEPEKLRDIKNVLETELHRRDVEVVFSYIGTMCLKNRGKISFSEIEETVSEVAMKFEVELTLTPNEKEN